MAELSADELALYDRQLRVWGAEGQNRIKQSSVLVVGLNGVGTEIVKNLVLAGVGSLEIQDASVLTEDQLSCQFFSQEQDLGTLKLINAEARIRDLNPRVKLSINTNELDLNDVNYFSNFNLIVANGLSADKLIKLNEISRELNVSLHVTVNHGLYGYIFNDLIIDVTSYQRKKMPVGRKVGKLTANREILEVKVGHNKETSETFENFKVKSSFKPFKDLKNTQNLSTLTRRQKKNLSPYLILFLALAEIEIDGQDINLSNLQTASNELIKKFGTNPIEDISIYETFLRQLNTEISPVVAILGGALAQDVINFLSKKEQPINNFLVLDGDKFLMPIYEL